MSNEEQDVFTMDSGSERVSREQNTASPVLVASGSVIRRRENRKRKEEMTRGQEQSVHAARKKLAESKSKSSRGARSRSRSSSVDDVSDDTADETPSKKGRKKTSIVWKHCTKKNIRGKDVTTCNYCPNSAWTLSGSTSSALYHIKTHHLGKLSHEELFKTKGNEQTTPTSTLPARSPRAKLYNIISLTSKRGVELNVLLLTAMLSSSTPFSSICDSAEWGMFVESLSHGQYRLPSRTYLSSSLAPAVEKALQYAVKEKLSQSHHISLTTDAWKSFNKISYITITSHHIDEQGQLHNILLCTNEIKECHTSQNLRAHIKGELKNGI